MKMCAFAFRDISEIKLPKAYLDIDVKRNDIRTSQLSSSSWPSSWCWYWGYWLCVGCLYSTLPRFTDTIPRWELWGSLFSCFLLTLDPAWTQSPIENGPASQVSLRMYVRSISTYVPLIMDKTSAILRVAYHSNCNYMSYKRWARKNDSSPGDPWNIELSV